MKTKLLYIIVLHGVLLLSLRAYAQVTMHECDTFSHNHIFQRVSINSPILHAAMDSCISVLKSCRFFSDSLESAVFVRPISSSDGYVYHMSFLVTTKSENELLSILDFSRLFHEITPVSCIYNNTPFIFFFNKTEDSLISIKDSYDTISFQILNKSYLYTSADNVGSDNIGENHNTITGYVFLRKNDDGEWYMNTIYCVQVDDPNILFENERIKLYSTPKGHKKNISGFHVVR